MIHENARAPVALSLSPTSGPLPICALSLILKALWCKFLCLFLQSLCGARHKYIVFAGMSLLVLKALPTARRAPSFLQLQQKPQRSQSVLLASMLSIQQLTNTCCRFVFGKLLARIIDHNLHPYRATTHINICCVMSTDQCFGRAAGKWQAHLCSCLHTGSIHKRGPIPEATSLLRAASASNQAKRRPASSSQGSCQHSGRRLQELESHESGHSPRIGHGCGIPRLQV